MAQAMTLREARDRYLADAGLSTDTYEEDWVDVKLGPVPMRLPSPAARKRVLPLHDLHHALTGYKADIIGEVEIGAWELASGLGPHAIGYALDLMTFAWSPWVAPRRVWRAFVRGRRSRNFYGEALPLDPAVLEQDLDATRRRLNIGDTPARGTMGDAFAFAGWYVLALLVGLLAIPLVPVMFVLGLWGQHQAQAQTA